MGCVPFPPAGGVQSLSEHRSQHIAEERGCCHEGLLRGLARLVLAELEALAARRGYTRVYLTTGPRQPEAKYLYLTSGYEPQFDLNEDPEVVRSLAFTKDLPVPRLS